MKAIVYHRYGSPENVLQLAEIEKPAPADGEVLIRVRAASVNPLDHHLMKGRPLVARLFFGLRKPKNTRPGVDVAGVIEAVGNGVTDFKAGDEVFGNCRGAFADYVCTAASLVVPKPGSVSFEQAASAPVAGFTAIQSLRGRLQPGHKVLINGAAGGVGTFALQIAKLYGAEVTGVCRTANLDLVRSLGADHVMDYTRDDYTKSGPYDLILDTVGNHSLSAIKRAMTPDGFYISVGAPFRSLTGFLLRWMTAIALSRLSRRKLIMQMAKRNKADIILLGEWMASGKLVPVLDRREGLNAVPDAIGHVGQRHTRGKVVITIGD